MTPFESTEIVLQKIGELKSQGFDEIHLPGGTSKDGSYYAGAVVPVLDTVTKGVYFLGVPYNPKFHINAENNHNKKAGESPEETVIRELLEETGLFASHENLKLLYDSKGPDNRPGKIGKFHVKQFYLVKEATGTIFDFIGPNPIDNETAAPLWIPASLFVKVIYRGHLKATYKAIDELCIEKEYAQALYTLVDTWSHT